MPVVNRTTADRPTACTNSEKSTTVLGVEYCSPHRAAMFDVA